MNRFHPTRSSQPPLTMYTGPEKFHKFGQYCSGAFKPAWENEISQKFCTNATRTNPAFNRALIGTWMQFYEQTDFQKAGLKMLLKLKWRTVYPKYEHAP